MFRPTRRTTARSSASCSRRKAPRYSHATGEFYDKAVAVKGAHARIEYLVRGLKWAVKRFEEAVPTLGPEARDVFVKMRDSHLRSIAACERVLQALPR